MAFCFVEQTVPVHEERSQLHLFLFPWQIEKTFLGIDTLVTDVKCHPN